MSAYSEWLASGGPARLIPTFEIKRDSAESLFLYPGYEDFTASADGVDYTFQPTSIVPALSKRDNSGAQSVTLQFQNVTSDVMQYCDEADQANESIVIIQRMWLSSDLTALAEPAIRMTVTSVDIEGDAVSVTAGQQDIINTSFNRLKYRAPLHPGLRYFPS